MPTKEEIIKALETLKRTCIESDDCFVCPLRDISDPQYCIVSRDECDCPKYWNINYNETWNAIK